MPRLGFALILTVLLLWGCRIGHGLDAGPPDGTGIKGTLVFHGEWPQETADIAVAVYKKLPQSMADFFSIAGWDTTVTLGTTRYEYMVPLEEPGNYEWIVVAWQPKGGFWNFSSLLGCHHVGSDSLPTPVEVRLGETAKGIDIHAYFDLVRGADLPDRDICTGFLPPLPGIPKPVGNTGRESGRPGAGR